MKRRRVAHWRCGQFGIDSYKGHPFRIEMYNKVEIYNTTDKSKFSSRPTIIRIYDGDTYPAVRQSYASFIELDDKFKLIPPTNIGISLNKKHARAFVDVQPVYQIHRVGALFLLPALIRDYPNLELALNLFLVKKYLRIKTE